MNNLNLDGGWGAGGGLVKTLKNPLFASTIPYLNFSLDFSGVEYLDGEEPIYSEPIFHEDKEKKIAIKSKS